MSDEFEKTAHEILNSTLTSSWMRSAENLVPAIIKALRDAYTQGFEAGLDAGEEDLEGEK